MQSPFPSRQDCQHTGWSWSILTRTYERGRTLRCKVFDYFHGWLYKKKRLIDFFFCFLKSRKLPYVSCSKKWLRRKGVCYILCERSDNGGFFCSSDRTQKKKESGPLHSKAEWSRRAEEQNNRWYGKVNVKRAWWQKRACLNLTGDWPHGSQYYSSVSALEWHNTKRSMDRQKACDFTSEDIRLKSLCPSSEGEEDQMTKVSKKMTLLGVKMIRLIHFIHLNNCSVWFQEMQYL